MGAATVRTSRAGNARRRPRGQLDVRPEGAGGEGAGGPRGTATYFAGLAGQPARMTLGHACIDEPSRYEAPASRTPRISYLKFSAFSAFPLLTRSVKRIARASRACPWHPGHPSTPGSILIC